MPNRQVRYENQTIHLDNLGDGQRHATDYDYNFANAGFSRFGDEDMDASGPGGGGMGGGHPNKSMNMNTSNNYSRTVTSAASAHTMTTYYPDFTGSREVGIDVGPLTAGVSGEPARGVALITTNTALAGHASSSSTTRNNNNNNNNSSNPFDNISRPSPIPPELPPLPALPKYSSASLLGNKSNGDLSLVSSRIVINDDRSANKSQVSRMPSDSSDDDDPDQNNDDDINFSYFDMYKKGIVVSDEATKNKPAISGEIASFGQKTSNNNNNISNKSPQMMRKSVQFETERAVKSEEEREEEEAEQDQSGRQIEDDDEHAQAVRGDKHKAEEDEADEEPESESQNIFSKDIEESLPELFGSYKSSSAVNLVNSLANTVESPASSSTVDQHRKLFAPNSVVVGKSVKPVVGELDIVRSRDGGGTFTNSPPQSQTSSLQSPSLNNKNDKLAIHRIPETETENDEYNEDAEDEHEDDEVRNTLLIVILFI